MAESRTISKTGAELQDLVEMVDQLTGEVFIPFSDFLVHSGTPAFAAVGAGGGYAMDAAGTESLMAAIRLPNGMPAIDYSKTVSMYIQWSAAATSGDVVWDLSIKPTAIGEDVGGAQTAGNVTDTTSGTADYLDETEVITIAASALENSDLLFLLASRLGGDGSDTMTGDASFHGVRISYTTNPNIV